MARKGSRRGGGSASRSAAAKKGWETRRQGGASAASKSTTATKPRKRGIEARIARSSIVQLNYTRSQLRPPGESIGSSGQKQSAMTPAKAQHMAKRKRQQKQALANLYGKLSPANKKRADAAMKRSNVMNG